MADSLPISLYRQEIVDTVQANQVTIIKAETGAGKSTQVPQFLLECASKVIVTQPRRLAAASIARRVAKEMGCGLGETVGYRTSMDRHDSESTRILFCTDGLEIVSEILGGNTPEGILVVDEVHEWNMNIEMLLAWVRHQIQNGVPYKLVLMSATIEHELLAQYFGDAAVIQVPGRMFPVTEQRPGKNVIEDAASLLRKGRNVLIFQPGKSEIKRTVLVLRNMHLDAEIFPLHAEMSLVDQMPCFLSYRRPKCIIATNIAQTSLTIPDIDAVVDSGLERRVESIEGIEGLYTRPIALADREQRKGRAGRTKPGIYIDACPADISDRRPFPSAEITRLPADKLVLQLSMVGLKAGELQFFHQPTVQHLERATSMLVQLGCLTHEGVLTDIGARVARLPTSPRFGRMLVEAETRRVLPEMINLVALMEAGNITNGKEFNRSSIDFETTWSDAFVQLAAYESAANLEIAQLEGKGIDSWAFTDVREHRQRLRAALRNVIGHWSYKHGSQKDVAASLYTGLVDHMYKRALIKGYKDKEGNLRELPKGSVVADADLVFGIPWNLQVSSEFGPKTRRLLTMATRVEVTLLKEVASHLITEKEIGDPNARGYRRARTFQLYFNGILLGEETRRAPEGAGT